MLLSVRGIGRSVFSFTYIQYAGVLDNVPGLYVQWPVRAELSVLYYLHHVSLSALYCLRECGLLLTLYWKNRMSQNTSAS